jgi:tripartite-type tricarboxylate transporter receptor subunit TctC
MGCSGAPGKGRGRIAGDAVCTAGRASEKRSPVMPDVPTLIEAMPNGISQDAWLALAAPAGTPPAIVDRLHATLWDAGKDTRPSSQRSAATVPRSSSTLPPSSAPCCRVRSRSIKSLIKQLGIKLE